MCSHGIFRVIVLMFAVAALDADRLGLLGLVCVGCVTDVIMCNKHFPFWKYPQPRLELYSCGDGVLFLHCCRPSIAPFGCCYFCCCVVVVFVAVGGIVGVPRCPDSLVVVC